MSKEYIKQHIVPACYLANFGANGNKGRVKVCDMRYSQTRTSAQSKCSK